MTKNILMVVTNVDFFGDGRTRTGLWFEEFAVPYVAFLENGYHVSVASLAGGEVLLDPQSENFINDIKWHDAKKALEDTEKLQNFNISMYDAIVFPGGHGPIFDIAESEIVGKIVSDFYNKGKLVAAICHGPSGLLTAKKDDGDYIVSGKRVTCFTNKEEEFYKKTELLPFSLEDALKDRHAIFEELPVGEINVVVDGNIITGQNYQSSETFANTILQYLEEKSGF